MRITYAFALCALSCAPAFAQNKSIVFTGRFPFVSLDAPNERAGGSITFLEEFDFSIATPDAANPFHARSWTTTTTHESFMGDPGNTHNYTFFDGFKSYFGRYNVAGPFVKDADRGSGNPRDIFWTVRNDATTLQLPLFMNNGTSVHVIQPGDFVRWGDNGNIEFFITQGDIMTAAGPQTGSWRDGASGICQDAAGNLYYTPAEGGHWVNGNFGGAVWCNDGSIIMIDASNITYDVNTGNVLSVAGSSARVLWEEVNAGPGSGISTRQMVVNSGGQDRAGANLGTFANMTGLEFDPGGTMSTPAYPDLAGNYNSVPDFLFCCDSGGYGGTVLSTANNGSVATINGVLMGSITPGTPADGSYLGVQLDIGNFQPTLMGICLVDAINYTPFVLDMPDFGSLQNNTTQTTFDIDGNFTPMTATFMLMEFGPGTSGGFAPSIPSNSIVPFSTGSYPQAFTYLNPTTIAILVTDANGYISYSVNNPHLGLYASLYFSVQAVALQGSVLTASNPIAMQLK